MSIPPSIYDMHIHTEFSPDSSTPLEAYAELADQYSIHIGFLDHLELAFFNRQKYLNYDNLSQLLEAFDNTQSQYPFTSLGLEVDFYSDRVASVTEFCDDYRKDFDYFVGTVHTIDGLAVTTKEELEILISRIGLQEILRRYFDEVEGAIRSRLFDGIAHIDGVMRFIPLYKGGKRLIHFAYQRTVELGKLCVKHQVPIEINLRGLRHPWGRMHPSQPLIAQLLQEGARFFVGSDSHEPQEFKDAAPQLRKVHAYLRKYDGLELPLRL